MTGADIICPQCGRAAKATQDAEKVACGLGHGYHRVCAHGWLMEDLEK